MNDIVFLFDGQVVLVFVLSIASLIIYFIDASRYYIAIYKIIHVPMFFSLFKPVPADVD
jgi:hypothetical protein